MKTKKWLLSLWTICAVLCFGSCVDENKWDDPAGNQKNPDTTVELLTTYTFAGGFEDIGAEALTYNGGEEPKTDYDPDKGMVLVPGSGYLRFANPLNGVRADVGGSVTMWVKISTEARDRALFSFIDETAGTVVFTGNGDLSYTGENSFEVNSTAFRNALTVDEWHFIGVAMGHTGYTIYVDGEEVDSKTVQKDVEGRSEFSGMVDVLLGAPSFYLAHGTATTHTEDISIGDVNIYRNAIAQRHAAPDNSAAGLPNPVYFLSFDDGLNGAQVIGNGALMDVEDEGFGRVFRNATGGMRQNYLLLPEEVLSHSGDTYEMTIGMWVNSTYAGEPSEYQYAPLFMAYGAAPVNGENTWPMFALQYRGLAQINNNGWCDFTNEQNVTGVNTEYYAPNSNDWLVDKEWHYYTATITETSVKIYFDGKIANEWSISGDAGGGSVSGLFTNGADLKYICLGGNQAWDWADNDGGFMFDDFAIYNRALTEDQIQTIIKEKMPTLPEPVYSLTFDDGLNGAQIIGGGSLTNVEEEGFGRVFRNATGGRRQNYLLLPEDVLSHSADTEEMTIGMWVNGSTAGASTDYMWSPLFTAYGAAPAIIDGELQNVAPMFALQYRGVGSINNGGGWTDLVDGDNVAGTNTLYHDALDWLADDEWHYYTAVITKGSVKIYFDGTIANEWALSGEPNGGAIEGLFTYGHEFKYICLGGNQGWGWPDDDPGFMFDDLVIYDKALTASEIARIIANK